MEPTKYRTFDDIRSIVTNGIPEGVSLEYKASEIVANRRIAKLCKTVTAFANSAGGQFVIGIEEKDNLPVKVDGGVPAPSRRDWIHQIVSTHTFPPVEAFEVFEIADARAIYYVVDVPASAKAPHQFEGRYYKRRGPHCEVMEHYEIEDVRILSEEKRRRFLGKVCDNVLRDL
jgi:predicted HTH transcriptional regulator